MAATTMNRYSSDTHGKKASEGYVTYLELQLDRITTACSATQKYGERIDIVSGQVTSMEEKVANLTKVVKLIQSYTEGQEQEMQKLKDEMKIPHLKLQTDHEAIIRRIVYIFVANILGSIGKENIWWNRL